MGSVTTDTTRTRRGAGGLILLLAAAGCASASGEMAPTSEAGGTTEPAPAATASQGASDGQDGAAASVDPNDPLGLGEEANTAVVVIGDERYEFSDLYCITMGGALSAQSVGSDPTVRIDLPPEDWETDTRSDWSPPGVQVNLEDGTAWIADPESTALWGIAEHPGLTGVDSFEIDETRGSGTATFMDAGAWGALRVDPDLPLPEPVQGMFEVTCAGG